MNNDQYISDLMTNVLLSTSYFPPISYLKAIINAKSVSIEQHENFVKKTYRNRCRIYSANGVINLTVPVEEATRRKVPVRDVRIDYSTNWQKQHLKSIESAYKSSPFYEYLIDDFDFVFNKRCIFLFDLNNLILERIAELLEASFNVKMTESFEVSPVAVQNYRDVLQAKKENENPFISIKEYHQVFIEKYGFQKDLSVLDLFFNLGGEAYSYLIEQY